MNDTDRQEFSEDVVESLDLGDVVRLKDDQGDFIVFSLDDGISVIKRAPVYDWEYHDLCGFSEDGPGEGYARLVWPEDLASVQYRTPLEPEVGDRILSRWVDGDLQGVHTGVVDEVKGRVYRVHMVRDHLGIGAHWDVEIEEDDILDMNSQRRATYQRCRCLESPNAAEAKPSESQSPRRNVDEPPWRRKPVARQGLSGIEKGFWLLIILAALGSFAFLLMA